MQRRQAQKASAAEAPTDDPVEGSGSKRTKVEAPLPSSTPAGRSYFLMKSEADVFSIDDLASRSNQTEPWDGETLIIFAKKSIPRPTEPTNF